MGFNLGLFADMICSRFVLGFLWWCRKRPSVIGISFTVSGWPVRRSGGDFPAFLGTFPAGCGTLPAVIHVVLGALLAAPVADVRTDRTILFGKRTVARQCAHALQAGFDAFITTGRAVVMAGQSQHLAQTAFTVQRACLACFDAGGVSGVG